MIEGKEFLFFKKNVEEMKGLMMMMVGFFLGCLGFCRED